MIGRIERQPRASLEVSTNQDRKEHHGERKKHLKDSQTGHASTFPHHRCSSGRGTHFDLWICNVDDFHQNILAPDCPQVVGVCSTRNSFIRIFAFARAAP